MKLNKTTTILAISISLLACTGQSKKENKANYELAREFEIDSVNLIYQYYQKYGFTDLCEEIQMISDYKKTITYENKLPITPEDLENIKPIFPCIGDSSLNVKRNSRSINEDIELDFREFSNDSNLDLNLLKGEYEYTQTEYFTTLKIYDAESGLTYWGIKKCDR